MKLGKAWFLVGLILLHSPAAHALPGLRFGAHGGASYTLASLGGIGGGIGGLGYPTVGINGWMGGTTWRIHGDLSYIGTTYANASASPSSYTAIVGLFLAVVRGIGPFYLGFGAGEF